MSVRYDQVSNELDPERTVPAHIYGNNSMLTIVSVSRTSARPYFLFLDDNLSKCEWIFTKLGKCNDIVEIWFGITNGQISSLLKEF